MPALRRTRMLVWKNRRVVKIGKPTKRVSPRSTAMMKDEHDISDTANSEKCSCRQNNSDGCSTVGMRSMPSAFAVPSMIGQVRGLLVMPMLSWRFMGTFVDVRAKTLPLIPAEAGIQHEVPAYAGTSG